MPNPQETHLCYLGVQLFARLARDFMDMRARAGLNYVLRRLTRLNTPFVQACKHNLTRKIRVRYFCH